MDDRTETLIGLALGEDIGTGDVTAEHFIPAEAAASASIVAREEAVVAGIEVAARVFQVLDGDLKVRIDRGDGAAVSAGEVVLHVSGSARAIVTAERTALNFLQRLSGVATATRRYVDAVAGTGVTILDTRKTTPGWRALEKAAVLAGGGANHRMGLFDMVMVKDNHLLAEDRSAALQQAIDRVKENGPDIRIELEADTLKQVRAFLELTDVDVILLDNMSPAELKEAVNLVGGRVKLEASGGVTLDTVRGIAETGVDFISVGAVTHSSPSVDFSLEFQDEG